MKNLFKTLPLMLLALSFLTFSCKEDDEDGPSNYSTEETKDNLDANMLKVVSETEKIENLKINQVLKGLDFLNLEDRSFKELLPSTKDFKGTSFSDIKKDMEEGIVTLTLSNQIKWGTYTYMKQSDTFKFEEGTVGTYKVLCPSNEASTTNDLIIDLSVTFNSKVNYDPIEGLTYEDKPYSRFDEEGNYLGWFGDKYEFNLIIKEIFTNIDLSVKMNSETLMAYNFNVKLDGEGIPASATTSLQLENLKINFATDASNRSQKVSSDFALSMNDTKLVGYNISVTGTLTDERVEKVVKEIERVDNQSTKYTKEFLASFNYDANIDFTIGDFLISGIADGAKLLDLFNEEGLEDAYPVDEYCTKFNDAVALTLKYQNGQVVGTAEIFPEECEGYGYWDEEKQEWVHEKYTYYQAGVRFKFEDGTYLTASDKDSEKEIKLIFDGLLRKIASLEKKYAGQF